MPNDSSCALKEVISRVLDGQKHLASRKIFTLKLKEVKKTKLTTQKDYQSARNADQMRF